MQYREAMKRVFAEHPDPQARSHAVAFLERYASAARPVTAWHSHGGDLDAVLCLLGGLGFADADYEVQYSALDPKAARVSWTASGLAKVNEIPGDIPSWADGAPEVQRSVLLGDADAALGLVPEGAAPEAAPEGQDAGARPCFRDRLLEATTAVAKRVAAQPGANVFARRWAGTVLDGEGAANGMPMAPLAVLEELARLEGADWLPDVSVFSDDMWGYKAAAMQGTRLVERGDALQGASRVNCIPLADQGAGCREGGGELDGYFAFTADDWRRFHAGGQAAWTQFDAPVASTEEALQFALDADGMRRFAERLVEHGYPGFHCVLLDTTRLAVKNGMAVPTADGGTVPMPGCDDLEDDDGDLRDLGARVDYSAVPDYGLAYMGGYVVSDRPVAPGASRARWGAACPTHPVTVVAAKDDGSDEDEDGAASDFGIRTDELASEWFMAVHGLYSAQADVVADSSIPETLWSAKPARRICRERELPRYRRQVQELTDGNLAARCSPDSAFLNKVAGATNPFGFGFTVPGAFVVGLCAVLRKAGGSDMKFVDVPPELHPDKMVSGLWSGLVTDRTPGSPDEAAAAGVFPDAGPGFVLESLPSANAEAVRRTNRFLELMRRSPSLQLRFPKRTKGTHRGHVIVVETNVQADSFARSVDTADARGQLEAGVRRLFTMCFLKRLANPLVGVDGSTYSSLMTRNCSPAMQGFMDWVDSECPKWSQDIRRAVGPAGLVCDDGLSVRWLVDSRGRLVLALRTTESSVALAARAAFRYASGIPVPSAGYCASRGKTTTAVVTEDMSGRDLYLAVLAAAMSQPGFAADREQEDTVGTEGMCGGFGLMWLPDASADIGPDYPPDREWYTSGFPMDPRESALFADPMPDMPF